MDKHSSEQQICKLPLFRKNSGAIYLAKPGLMADWLADKMRKNFKFLKFSIHRSNFKLFTAFNTVTALLEQYECI